MRTHSILVLFVLFFTACSQKTRQLESGIEGTVTIGPACPVIQEDVPCPDQPYQATLTVLTTSGKQITQFQTDEQGRFQVDLSPGEYVLHPESPNGLPFAADIPFSVDENKFTQLVIGYDSGIR